MQDVEALAYAAALALGGIFAVAGAGKLRRLAETRAALRAVELPHPGLLAPILAFAELAVAGALAVAPRAGGAAALAALSGFSLFAARTLRRGIDAGCGCFGGTGEEKVSAATLLRNLLLALPAAAALVAAEPLLPGLPQVVAVSAGFLAGALALSMLRLRLRAGAVWSNRTAFLGAEPR